MIIVFGLILLVVLISYIIEGIILLIRNEEGIFVGAFQRTFGDMAGLIVYVSCILVCVIGLAMGIYLFVEADKDKCLLPITTYNNVLYRASDGTNRYTQIPAGEICLEKKPEIEVSETTKAKYYGGMTMIIVFGLILLMVLTLYIIEGIKLIL